MTTMQAQLDSFENPINTYYTKLNGVLTVTPAFAVLEIPTLNITFDLSGISSVYLSFTCQAEITAVAGTSSVWFFFAVDGEDVLSPVNRVGNTNGGSTKDFFSVNLQHVIENMTAGIHNVTVRVSSESTVNTLSSMTLYVQTFTP